MVGAFPVIEVSGGHEDLGRVIGRHFRDKIQKKVFEYKLKNSEYQAFLSKSKKYYRAALAVFPELIAECREIAAGARVGLWDYFLLNTREVADSGQNLDNCIDSADRCTTAVSFGPDGAVIGHNEDWQSGAIGELYVLRATVDGVRLLGLCYGTELPGTGVAMNSFGLVQGINELHSSPGVGVPKNFLARAVLGAESLTEAQQIIACNRRASGYNHVLVQNRELKNIEATATGLAVENYTAEPFVHTNHFLSPALKKQEILCSGSSVARLVQARKLLRNNFTKDEMVGLLGDTGDDKNPICRRTNTIGSVVLLPNTGEGYFCYGPPCAPGAEFEQYKL